MLDHMSRILRTLQTRPLALFAELFPREGGRAELVVTLLALLELVRERLVEIVQTAPFAPIHARLCHGEPTQ